MKRTIIFFLLIISVYSYVFAQDNIHWYQPGFYRLGTFFWSPFTQVLENKKIALARKTDACFKIIDLNSYNVTGVKNLMSEIGSFVVTPGEEFIINNSLEIYDIETGEYKRSIDTSGIDSLITRYKYISRDGKYFTCYIYNYEAIRFYNLLTGAIIRDMKFSESVGLLGINENDEVVLGYSDSILIYNILSGKRNYQYYLPGILGSTLPENGRIILSSSDSLLSLIDFDNNHLYLININQANLVSHYDLESDTQILFINNDSNIAYCKNGELIIRSLENGNIVNSVQCSYFISNIQASYNSKYIILSREGAGAEAISEIYDVDKEELHPLICHSGEILGLAFSKDGNYLYSYEYGELGSYIQKFDIITKKRVWKTPNFREQSKENIFYRHFYPFVLSPNNNYTAVCSQGDTSQLIYIFDLVNPSSYPTYLLGHKHTITSLAFTKDEKFLASGGLDSMIYIWDIENFSLLKTINVNKEIYLINFKNEDEIYAVIADDGFMNLNLFRISTGEKLNIGIMAGFDGNFYYRYPIAISTNNKYLATNISMIKSSGDFSVLDVESLNWTSNFDTLDIFSLAFSPDEKFLATGHIEPFIKIWDFKNKKVAAQYDYNPFIKISNYLGYGPDSIYPPIKAIAFSPDGRFVAGGNDDGSVIIWENTLINVEENTIKKGSYTFYPNPASETVNIKYNVPASCIVNITITNLLGNYQQSILNERKVPGEYQFEINTANLPSGLYLLRYSDGISATTTKCVIAK